MSCCGGTEKAASPTSTVWWGRQLKQLGQNTNLVSIKPWKYKDGARPFGSDHLSKTEDDHLLARSNLCVNVHVVDSCWRNLLFLWCGWLWWGWWWQHWPSWCRSSRWLADRWWTPSKKGSSARGSAVGEAGFGCGGQDVLSIKMLVLKAMLKRYWSSGVKNWQFCDFKFV